ncbi:hypothetical protein JTB14_017807 [Gonioctena quinquepunctata]|nr:hypothetical protein JTB14_017807 [Gonioctena quinquepunctata]
MDIELPGTSTGLPTPIKMPSFGKERMESSSEMSLNNRCAVLTNLEEDYVDNVNLRMEELAGHQPIIEKLGYNIRQNINVRDGIKMHISEMDKGDKCLQVLD